MIFKNCYPIIRNMRERNAGTSSRARQKLVQVALSDAEYEMVKSRAALRDLTIPEVLREAVRFRIQIEGLAERGYQLTRPVEGKASEGIPLSILTNKF